jgi:hypothetical protein
MLILGERWSATSVANARSHLVSTALKFFVKVREYSKESVQYIYEILHQQYLTERKGQGATTGRVCLILGIILLLKIFDKRSTLLKGPDRTTMLIGNTRKRIRDALTTAVHGKPVNESDIVNRMGPFDLPCLYEILGCDTFSVENLLQNLHSNSSDECHEVLANAFNRETISTVNKTLADMKRFYAMVKAPGGSCQLRAGFACNDHAVTDANTPIRDPQLAIVVIAAGVQDDASKLSLRNKEQYASMHEYDLHVLGQLPSGCSRKIPWFKIPYIKSLLHKYDYVWSLDLDTLILDMDFDVKRLIDDRFDLVVGIDPNGINTGSFIIKNSIWSSLLLYTWWLEDDVKPLVWWEQAALHKIGRNPLIGNHLKQIRQEAFNSYEGNIKQNPEKIPFVLHFPGDPSKWSKIVNYSEILKNATDILF